MTNKEIVRKVIAGIEANDIDAIANYVTDDVHLNMIGDFTTTGKDEFLKSQKPNNESSSSGTITVINEIEKGNIVIVEGRVNRKMENGEIFEAFFSDFFELENGKIKEMRFYLVPKNKPA